jgi:hypothetical protein
VATRLNEEVQDQLLAVTFLALLLLFWLIMMDALRKTDPEQRKWKTFYLPKVPVLAYDGVA